MKTESMTIHAKIDGEDCIILTTGINLNLLFAYIAGLSPGGVARVIKVSELKNKEIGKAL